MREGLYEIVGMKRSDYGKWVSEPIIPRINISYYKNDNGSIYIVDLVGALLGIREAEENIKEFCKRKENKIQEIENNIPKMVETIDKYFKD